MICGLIHVVCIPLPYQFHAGAAYGRGVYFALKADYSANDKYSPPDKDKDGEKHILVCTMLVGKYTRGNKDMKVAPALPNNPQVYWTDVYRMLCSPVVFAVGFV